jgi:hypothetical protein
MVLHKSTVIHAQLHARTRMSSCSRHSAGPASSEEAEGARDGTEDVKVRANADEHTLDDTESQHV